MPPILRMAFGLHRQPFTSERQMPTPFPPDAVTEQLTPAGRCIEHRSFAIIDAEAGPHDYSAAQWAVVRRLIHSSADFAFNGLTQFHPQAIEHGLRAIRAGRPIITDVAIIQAGLSSPRLAHFGLTVHQFIHDPEVIAQARQHHTTRAVQAMRKAQRLGLLHQSILAIGNAPTALDEVLRLQQSHAIQPALIIGMPVGFVGAAESKAALAQQTHSPWIITCGRKGGSTLVIAAIHALLSLAHAPQPHDTGR